MRKALLAAVAVVIGMFATGMMTAEAGGVICPPLRIGVQELWLPNENGVYVRKTPAWSCRRGEGGEQVFMCLLDPHDGPEKLVPCSEW